MKKVLILSVLIGILFWFLEAAVHVFILHEGNYYLQALNPPRHEIWMRLPAVCLFVCFGLYMQKVVDRRKRSERELKQVYRELSQIFDTAADGMRVIDREFNILRVNETFSILTGVRKEGAVGRKCYDVFGGPFCHTQKCSLVKVIDTNKRFECYVEKERRDGVKIPCIVTATPFRNTEGTLTGIVEDFKSMEEYNLRESKLKDLNEKLRKSNKRLKNLVLRDPHTGLYNHCYLEGIIESEFNRAERCVSYLSLIMLDIDYFKSINEVYGHDFGDLVLRQLARQTKRMVRQYDSIIRYGGEEIVIISPHTDKGSAMMLAQRILEAVNQYRFGDEQRGVKLKVSIAVISYPDDRVTRGMELVGLAEQVLNKAKNDGGNRVYCSREMHSENIVEKGKDDIEQLKKEIEKLTKRASQNVVEAIFAFAKTIELRDHYTGEHVENTVRYTTEIARVLNLPENEIEYFKEAAVLHDLGKIGISDKILLKKGKLTPEEYEEIKRHPQIGVDIIRPIQSLRRIIPLILCHHERWDGGGYPQRLKGEQIPIGARIIAVADVYQALISDRPYRKAFSQEEAKQMIGSSSGTQFDPQIAEVFLSNIN